MGDDDDAGGTIFRMFTRMTNLKELFIVYDLDLWPSPDHGQPTGEGPMELHDSWPRFLEKLHLETSECHEDCEEHDSEHGCNCMDLPEVSPEWVDLQGITVVDGVATFTPPVIRNVWGWRPVFFEY